MPSFSVFFSWIPETDYELHGDFLEIAWPAPDTVWTITALWATRWKSWDASTCVAIIAARNRKTWLICISKNSIWDAFHRLKYISRTEFFTNWFKSKCSRERRCSEYDDNHDEETDDRISDHVDRWVHLVFIAAWYDQEKSSPENKNDCEDDGDKQENGDTNGHEFFQSVNLRRWISESRCLRVDYRGEHGSRRFK